LGRQIASGQRWLRSDENPDWRSFLLILSHLGDFALLGLGWFSGS
jgi:hypothetical protein